MNPTTLICSPSLRSILLACTPHLNATLRSLSHLPDLNELEFYAPSPHRSMRLVGPEEYGALATCRNLTRLIVNSEVRTLFVRVFVDLIPADELRLRGNRESDPQSHASVFADLFVGDFFRLVCTAPAS